MAKYNLPSSVVIVGAGASGLFAARRLRQLGVKEITLIEKEAQVGGKCSTYVDPANPEIMAERGAVVVAPNYGEVLDALKETGVGTCSTLSVKRDTVEIVSKTQNLQGTSRLKFIIQFASEIKRFNRLVSVYRKSVCELKPIPEELQEPFAQYAKTHRLENLNMFLKPFVTGFGYGDMGDCPTYSVLEYMGYMTIPFLLAQYLGWQSCELRSIDGGFQHLMQEMAKDFSVLTSSKISHIKRSASGCQVFLSDSNGQKQLIEAEALILAVSPLQWEDLLGKENLTAIEQACLDHVTYYRYPVIICRLKGFPPNYVYRPEGLEKANFGHVALITTFDQRENPPEGRLCTAYINVPSGCGPASQQTIECALEGIKEDLLSFPGVQDAEIVEVKIWEDYFSSLPWDLRLELEARQFSPDTKTLYVGSYTLGCFEDVASVAGCATNLINRCFQAPPSSIQVFFKDVRRFFSRSFSFSGDGQPKRKKLA